MKRLSQKKDWNKLYKGKKNKYSSFKYLLSYSAQNYDLFRLIKKNTGKQSQGKLFLEIGCAPGTYLIRAYKKLKVIPVGVDYLKEGIKKTKENLLENGITKFELYTNDIFDKNFIKNHKGRYDFVFSNGFVEHFDDYIKIAEIHSQLAKKGGYIIISVPNLNYINNKFTPKETKKICNFDVMRKEFLEKNKPSKTKIVYCNYYGGLFNTGLVSYKGPLEAIRMMLFIGQRLIIDPIFILMLKCGIPLKLKYTSPEILIILKKNE